MTIDEAIKVIKRAQAEDTISIYRYIDLDDVIKLLQEVGDAEEYRKPKKILCDKYVRSNGELGQVYGCPTCEVILPHEGAKYCWNCGQALDWSNWIEANVRKLKDDTESNN